MNNKLTITIEYNDVGVGLSMTGHINNRALLQGTVMIINQVCKITKISPVKLFKYAALMAEEKPTSTHGTCVTVKGGVGDE